MYQAHCVLLYMLLRSYVKYCLSTPTENPVVIPNNGDQFSNIAFHVINIHYCCSNLGREREGAGGRWSLLHGGQSRARVGERFEFITRSSLQLENDQHS